LCDPPWVCFYGVDLPASTKIGPGFKIEHLNGIVVNPDVVIGKNCNIYNGVTIGKEKRGIREGCPTIADEVWIGANAVVVGRIQIGSDVLIAPGAYVNFDVPSHSIVLGNPAKIVAKENATEKYHNCMDCVKCNQSALSLKKIVVLQSPVYRKLKNTHVVKLLRSRHRKNFFEETETETAASAENTNVAQNKNYEKLREYYVSMLKMIDFIHFNSSVTEMVYNRYFHPKSSAVISITHRDIKDHRKRKNFDHDVLRITYLGPAKPFKGFQFLIGVLDDIWRETPGKFELHIYTNTNIEREYITHLRIFQLAQG